MKKLTTAVLLVGILWLATGGGLALADGMLLPEDLSPDYLVVRYHHVTVRIEDGLAVTRVEQEFHNPHGLPVKGHYLFPVPPEAMLSHFQAVVDGYSPTVVRQDREATNAALFPIIAQRHDPSLLQYADWETLAFDLSLPAYGSRRMTLEYEELLRPAGGLYRYRYVLSTERYTSQPLQDVSVTVDLHSSSGLSSLYSSSHTVTTDLLGSGRARVSWQATETIPTQDFELFFAPTEEGFGGGLLTGRRNGEDHFLFLFSPQVEPLQADYLPKDIVFVLDRSGSMAGEKIDQARKGLHFILDQLGEQDRFSIVCFDDRRSVLDYNLLPVQRQPLSVGHRFVDGVTADGRTDLEAGLQAGLSILARSDEREASRQIVFLTDGLPTAGITDERLVARLVAEANGPLQARLHVFGVGYDVNTHLLDRLAADNGGTVTYVQPGEDLEGALTGFYRRIAHPLLTDVEVELEGLRISDLSPQAIPDLFEGSSLLLAGRYEATSSSVTVRVRGWAAGKEREFTSTFDLDEMGDRDFVPRLWATRRIGELLDQVRVEGESEALRTEIRKLGMAYGLVTPYTTFVIESQVEGVASADNMSLYDDAALNWTTGRTTIQARVQNQAYQQADQADLAIGANVVNSGQHSLAQVGRQNLDLSLLPDETPAGEPVSQEWVESNIQVDRSVEFGSEEYFELAEDPEARLFLQSGRNVLFPHRGQVISVLDPADQGQQVGQADAASNRTSNAAANATANAVPNGQIDPTQSSPPPNAILDDLEVLLDWLASFLR
jgi:Ca-activated chloride channel family protein